jgi:hypothetical protein
MADQILRIRELAAAPYASRSVEGRAEFDRLRQRTVRLGDLAASPAIEVKQ